MSGVEVNRRAVLGAMAVLPGLGLAPRAWAAGTFHFILDARLPEAAALLARADAAGHSSVDPAGEIIRLLLSEEGRMPGTIVGLTTYSDYVLARDALRMQGRPVSRPYALPGGEIGHPLLSALRDACARRCASRATSFLWLA